MRRIQGRSIQFLRMRRLAGKLWCSVLHKDQNIQRHCSIKTLCAKHCHGVQMSTAFFSLQLYFAMIYLDRTRFPVKDHGTFSRMSPEPCVLPESRSVISSSVGAAIGVFYPQLPFCSFVFLVVFTSGSGLVFSAPPRTLMIIRG